MESLCKVVLGAQQKAPNLNALNALNATFKSTFCLSKWFLGQYLCKRPQKSVSCYWQICSGSIFKVLPLKIFLWGILIVHDDDDRADDEIEEASAEHLTKGSIRVMEWGKCIVSWWILDQHHLVRITILILAIRVTIFKVDKHHIVRMVLECERSDVMELWVQPGPCLLACDKWK